MELFEQAQRLHLQGKFSEAEKLYDELLTQNHDNAGLMATLGTLMLQTDRLGMAIHLLEAASAKLKQGDILCNLGIAYKQSGQYDKCKKAFREAMRHDPSADTIANYSALYINVGDPDRAIRYGKKALDRDSNCPIAHWNISMGHLERGEFAEGWKHWEWGSKCHPPMRVDRKLGNKPLWDGTPGKIVAVYGEQGLGDEIMFASMLPDLMKTNTVILESHKRLKHLFEHSFPGLQVFGTREEKAPLWPADHHFDYQISIGSLGQFFRNKREDFPGTPYISAAPAKRGDKFRVGISWTGGLKVGRIRTRTIPLDMWAPILSQDCEFISMQYTDCKDDLARMKERGYPIKQYDAIQANDYYETARLVASCDLIISCCTSVIHLAGAMGVPCWVMTPHKVAWRYGVKGPMPWYRSVRLYRQPIDEDWRGVLQVVTNDLQKLLADKEQECKPDTFIRAALIGNSEGTSSHAAIQ